MLRDAQEKAKSSPRTDAEGKNGRPQLNKANGLTEGHSKRQRENDLEEKW